MSLVKVYRGHLSLLENNEIICSQLGCRPFEEIPELQIQIPTSSE